MSKKNIYHGSDHVVRKPIYGFGKTFNDYGLGFYCTEDLKMAKEWSVSNEKSGYANCYELELEGLDILNLSDPQYCILHWLAMLLKFRTFTVRSGLALEAKEYILKYFLVDYREKDIIIGYRADDSYFSFAQDFISGVISYRQLKNAMYLGQLGEQFVLKSRKAFGQIKFIGFETATVEEWYSKRMLRDKKARREYLTLERNRRQKDDIYITQILNEEMKPYDPRL